MKVTSKLTPSLDNKNNLVHPSPKLKKQGKKNLS